MAVDVVARASSFCPINRSSNRHWCDNPARPEPTRTDPSRHNEEGRAIWNRSLSIGHPLTKHPPARPLDRPVDIIYCVCARCVGGPVRMLAVGECDLECTIGYCSETLRVALYNRQIHFTPGRPVCLPAGRQGNLTAGRQGNLTAGRREIHTAIDV